MTQLLSSKVAIEEEEPKVRPIEGVPTSIAAAVGVTERGPIATPTLVTSFDEYVDIFGGFTADSDLALAVSGFFDNGGEFIYIVRTVHFTNTGDVSTKTSAKASLTLQTPATSATPGSVTGSKSEPFELAAGDDLDIAVDGGAASTATFNATAASETSGNTEPFGLADGDVLDVKVDDEATAQSITFLAAEFSDITNATAAEVAAVINAKISGASASASGGAVVITSDTLGTDSAIEVTGGTANAAGKLNFPTAKVDGTGNVADITAVTAAEAKTVIEAAVSGVTVTDVSGAVKIESNTTGTSSDVQVQSSSTADTKFGFDNAVHSGSDGSAQNTLDVDGKTDGTYANDLEIKIEDATSGESDEFNLLVIDDGVTIETYPNVTMVDTADRYVEDVVNADVDKGGSPRITVTDLDASTASQRPANGTFGPMTGGDDGLTGLVDADFVGDENGPTGLRALDTVQDARLLIVPAQTSSAVHNAMITYCEVTRDLSMFPILDPPEDSSATEVITYFDTTAGLIGLSEFGAAYWPWIEILNPRPTVFGDSERITVAPSGHVAGVYARTASAREGGVYDPPAGTEEGRLFGVLGFETDEVFDERKRDLVQPKRINILTKFSGAPRHIDGSYTLKANGNFPFVAQRLGAIYIEQSIKDGTEFARNKNNTPKLRRTVERSIRSFLRVQLRNGAFASDDPDLAFFVNLSTRLNTPAIVNSGKMIGRIGLAFNTPAVWIILRFSKDTRAIDQEQAG